MREATLSNSAENGNGCGGGPELGDVPENCVACVFMHLTPPEICNLARLNRAFRRVASSDSEWDSKLPLNYPLLLDLPSLESYESIYKKKGIFAILSRPVLFDEGSKVVWLNRVAGAVCVLTGVEDRRYWSWIGTEEFN